VPIEEEEEEEEEEVTLAATQLLNYLRNKSHSEKFQQKYISKKFTF